MGEKIVARGDAETAEIVEIVLKHCDTGEILGYSAPFDVPTRAVRAVRTRNGWREIQMKGEMAWTMQ